MIWVFRRQRGGARRLPASCRRGRDGPCRHHLRRRDVAPRSLLPRLASSARDMCAVPDADLAFWMASTIPRASTHRLLLGLKGTMSEAELHIIKQRMIEGKRAKARRESLACYCPSATFWRSSGEIIKDPDEQARTVVQDDLRAIRGARDGDGRPRLSGREGDSRPGPREIGTEQGRADVESSDSTYAAKPAEASDVRRRLRYGPTATDPHAKSRGGPQREERWLPSPLGKSFCPGAFLPTSRGNSTRPTRNGWMPIG